MGDDEIVEKILTAFYGRNISFNELRAAAKQTLLTEREFNRKAGIGDEQDELPRFMREEKLILHHTVFGGDPEELRNFYRDF